MAQAEGALMSQKAESLGTSRPVQWATRVAAVLLMSVSAAACVTAGASPTVYPPLATATTAAAADSYSTASAMSLAAATEDASPTTSTTSSATPVQSAPSPKATSAASRVPSPTVTPATSWTGIHWTAGPSATSQQDGVSISIAGWSGGYVAFRIKETAATDGAPETSSVTPTRSTDGLHWTDGKPLDISGFDISEWVGNVVEGPAGLLAAGYMTGIACGGPAAVNGIWMSADGITWRRTTMAGFGGGTVYQIDAGSIGYVATGKGPGPKPAAYVWTSKDGLSWTGTNLDAAAYQGIELTNATAFAGGFVMAGANPDLDVEGCGTGTLTPSLWWSPDGKTWTRDVVNGTTPDRSASFRVSRISDHMLLAYESSYNAASNSSTNAVWTSTDGRTWKKDADQVLIDNTVVTYGPRGLVVSTRIDQMPVDFWDIRADLTLVKLAQTGDRPTEALANGACIAFGPRGVVVAKWDGSQSWIGVPTAG